LVTNPTGVDRNLESTISLFHKNPGINLVALYGPEHGVRGNAQAGEYVSFYMDEKYKIPVFSLYGQSKKPVAGMLKDIDEYMRSFDTKKDGKIPEISDYLNSVNEDVLNNLPSILGSREQQKAQFPFERIFVMRESDDVLLGFTFYRKFIAVLSENCAHAAGLDASLGSPIVQCSIPDHSSIDDERQSKADPLTGDFLVCILCAVNP